MDMFDETKIISCYEADPSIVNLISSIYNEIYFEAEKYKDRHKEIVEHRIDKLDVFGQNSIMDVYSIIGDYSLASLPWLIDLWVLTNYSSRCLTGSLMEVGAWRGGSGGLMATMARMSGILDDIYLCDTFRGVVKAGEKDTVYVGGEHSDTSISMVNDLIYNKMGLEGVFVLGGIFPEETSYVIDDEETFRFCHIDVDVYQSAHDVFEWVWPRMVVGGFILYDDYGHGNCPGVRAHVEEHLEDKDKVIFITPFNRAAMFCIESPLEKIDEKRSNVN